MTNCGCADPIVFGHGCTTFENLDGSGYTSTARWSLVWTYSPVLFNGNILRVAT